MGTDLSALPNMQPDCTTSSEFKFLGPFNIPEGSANGLVFNDVYIPEEVLVIILSFVPPKQLLRLSEVCKTWSNLIKSETIWMHIYFETFHKKARKLPWYVYYSFLTTDNFQNLLKNGNGERKFKHWKIRDRNYGNKVHFKIEDPPAGSDPLPLGVPDFNGRTSCFSTTYYSCRKGQVIPLAHKRLLRYIIREFKPQIYVSEWVAGRFDCGCIYKLEFSGFTELLRESDDRELPSSVFTIERDFGVEQWQGKDWKKIELTVDEYPDQICCLLFEHMGKDTQFWAGHYGSKMAGGVVKFVLDSIKVKEN